MLGAERPKAGSAPVRAASAERRSTEEFGLVEGT